MRTLVENTCDMNKRVQLVILATAAILLNSVCFCMAAVPVPAESRDSHQQQGDCPAHQHQHSCGEHACCQAGACNSPSQIRGEGSDRPNPFDSIAFAVGVQVAGIRLAAASSALIAKEHSAPSPVPVFFSHEDS